MYMTMIFLFFAMIAFCFYAAKEGKKAETDFRLVLLLILLWFTMFTMLMENWFPSKRVVTERTVLTEMLSERLERLDAYDHCVGAAGWDSIRREVCRDLLNPPKSAE